MANPVAGRVLSRAAAPDRIEAELAAVWRDVAREGPVSRAVMSNLVVYCRCPADRDVDLASPPARIPVDGVARDHPSRVILLHHDPDAPGARLPLAAHVGVLIFGAPGAHYGVEQIVIRSACSEAALPSIVRPLMLGDVPTSVWWTEDFSGTHPLTPLVTMGRQLIYDSRRWRDVGMAVRALTPLLQDQFRPDLADLNWRRLTPVRQALLHASGSGGTAKRSTGNSVRIRHRTGEAALGWLLAGWLESAWGPPSGGPIRLKPDPTIAVVPIRLKPDPTITVDEDPRLRDDTLIASLGDDLELRLGDRQVTIHDALGPAPFTMAIPREDEAQTIAAELRVLMHDAVFHHTLSALARRFGAA